MVEWSIREMVASDLDAALRVWEEAGVNATEPIFSVAEVIASVTRGDPAVVAEADGVVVGTACSLLDGDRAWICRLALATRWRNRGIGSELLIALEQRLTEHGVTRMSALLHADEIGEVAFGNQHYAGPFPLRYFDRRESYGPNQAQVVHDLGGRIIAPNAWSELGGGRETKELIERSLILPLANQAVAERHGLRPPGAAILFGPPGTGKTSLARGVAGRLGWPFIEVFPAQLGSSPVEIASGIRSTFDRLLSVEHAVVFIDEVDEVASRRMEHSTGQAITNELLKAIPGFHKMPGRLLICATNNISRLDPAFVRTGRFDYLLPIGPPDLEVRHEALEALFARVPTADVNVVDVASRTEGYTLADLDHVMRRAAQLAFERALAQGGESQITQRDLDQALEGTRPSVRPEDLEVFVSEIANFARF